MSIVVPDCEFLTIVGLNLVALRCIQIHSDHLLHLLLQDVVEPELDSAVLLDVDLPLGVRGHSADSLVDGASIDVGAVHRTTNSSDIIDTGARNPLGYGRTHLEVRLLRRIFRRVGLDVGREAGSDYTIET